MTLGDFLTICDQNPSIVIFYFAAVPLSALLALIFGRNQGHLSPWKYLYAALIYLALVPGLFALTITIYLLVIERSSLLEINLFAQALPIFSMILTTWLITRNVKLDQVPGFDKLSDLVMIILGVLIIMWVLDRTRLIAFTYVPFVYVVGILASVFLLIRVGMRRMSR